MSHSSQKLVMLGFSVIVTIAAFSSVAVAAKSQIPQHNLKGKSAKDLLTRSQQAAEKTGSGGNVLSLVLAEREKYQLVVVDSVVNGLEWMALNLKDGRARMWAAQTLANAGSVQRPLPGIFDRLLGLYRRANDPYVRSTIIGRMEAQRERARAIAFLTLVALEKPKEQDFAEASFLAVTALSHMGVDGRAALVGLRNGGKMSAGRAIGFVNWYLNTQ